MVTILCGATQNQAKRDVVKKYLRILCVSELIPILIFGWFTMAPISVALIAFWVLLNVILCRVEMCFVGNFEI